MLMSLAQTYKGIDRNVFYFGGTFKVCSWECWLKLNLNQSVALMVLILIPDLLLLSALAVSYCLPLRTFSAPPLSHTNTFSGLESATKFNNKSQASPKKAPPQHNVLHSSGLWSLKQRCSCGTAVRASASSIHFPQLTSLTPPAAAGLTQQQREGIRYLVCDCASLKSGWGERKCSRPGWAQPLEDAAWKPCLHCIHSWPDTTVMSGVTAVINIGILSFPLLVSSQTSTWKMQLKYFSNFGYRSRKHNLN